MCVLLGVSGGCGGWCGAACLRIACLPTHPHPTLPSAPPPLSAAQDPASPAVSRYADQLVEARKAKQLSREGALDLLQDLNMFGAPAGPGTGLRVVLVRALGLREPGWCEGAWVVLGGAPRVLG